MDLKDIKKEIKNLESEILKMSKELKMKQNEINKKRLEFKAKLIYDNKDKMKLDYIEVILGYEGIEDLVID